MKIRNRVCVFLIWIILSSTNLMATAPLIPTEWQMPDEFRQRLGTTAGRQRLMESEGHVLLVLHQVPDANETTRRGVLFWRNQQGEWRASNGEIDKVALDKHLQAYQRKVDEYDLMEDHTDHADGYLKLLEGLSPVVRASRNMLQVLDEARKALPSERNLIDHRDLAYDISRNAELLYDDAKNSMEVAVVRRAEEQSQSSKRMVISAHRLNILAALFFPFATLGAALGTTLTDNWSWRDTYFPFAIFVTISLITGAILARFIIHVPESDGK